MNIENLQSWTKNYQGDALLHRYLFLAKNGCGQIQIDAARGAVKWLRNSFQTKRYRDIALQYETLTDHKVDEEWASSLEQQRSQELQVIDKALKAAKDCRDAEAAFLRNDQVGNFYFERGEYELALSCYTRNEAYAGSKRHVIWMHMQQIKACVPEGRWADIGEFANLALAAINGLGTEPTRAFSSSSSSSSSSNSENHPSNAKWGGSTITTHRFQIGGRSAHWHDFALSQEGEYTTKELALVRDFVSGMLGMAHYQAQRYREAAVALVQVRAEMATHYSDVVPVQEVALHTTLAALHAFGEQRETLRARVVENAHAMGQLRTVPTCAALVTSFFQGRYGECMVHLQNLQGLAAQQPRLQSTAATLVRSIRASAMLQYLRPFARVELSRMASSFFDSATQTLTALSPLQSLENEVRALILAGRAPFRIDSQRGLLIRVSSEPRLVAFRGSLNTGQHFLENAHALLFAASAAHHGITFWQHSTKGSTVHRQHHPRHQSVGPFRSDNEDQMIRIAMERSLHNQ